MTTNSLQEGLPEIEPQKPELTDLRSRGLAHFWLSAIIESAEDAIISKSLEGIIMSWNKGAERVFGYTADEVIGKPVTILIPEDHLDEEPAILSRLRRGERIEHYETIRKRKNGELINISLTVSPILDDTGRVIGASKIARDITERTRAQEALRRSEQELADFFENAVVGLHWVGPDGIILRANRAELEMLGYKPEEYIGHHIGEFHADKPVISDILRRLQSGAVLHEYPARLRCKDGSIKYVLIDSSVRWEKGEFIHTRCFTRDVTESKRAEAERERLFESERQARREAEEAGRLKDEFLATVSHELRTPLTAILGWSNMLRSRRLNERAVANALETIERNARFQSQLIDDLLDVSRIITGKLRLDIKQTSPSSFIEAALESLMPAAEAKGVRVQKVMDAGLNTIAGDPQRLQQVVWNLLANAIKFTPHGGRVQVRLERVNSHIKIVVSDTGAGIKPEFLPYVFDRFRQADQSTTRKYGGLGIGLSIVRHLVELHGGTVHAESAGENQGSTFIVRLPASPPHVSVETLESEHSMSQESVPAFNFPERLDGVKVLVVEDEADTRELLKTVLAESGAEVTVAASASEALRAMQKSVPHLLISDIGMAVEDGYDLIRQVRALPEEAGGKVAAIALTAYARTEDRLRALRAGYQTHVPKPVELAELVMVAASLVRREDEES